MKDVNTMDKVMSSGTQGGWSFFILDSSRCQRRSSKRQLSWGEMTIGTIKWRKVRLERRCWRSLLFWSLTGAEGVDISSGTNVVVRWRQEGPGKPGRGGGEEVRDWHSSGRVDHYQSHLPALQSTKTVRWEFLGESSLQGLVERIVHLLLGRYGGGRVRRTGLPGEQGLQHLSTRRVVRAVPRDKSTIKLQ